MAVIAKEGAILFPNLACFVRLPQGNVGSLAFARKSGIS